MATLTTDLSARLWSDGICTRWTAIRGFANSSLVPPLPSFSQSDNEQTGQVRGLSPNQADGHAAWWLITSPTQLYRWSKGKPETLWLNSSGSIQDASTGTQKSV